MEAFQSNLWSRVLPLVAFMAQRTEGYATSKETAEDALPQIDQTIALIVGRGLQTMIVEMTLPHSSLDNQPWVLPIESEDTPRVSQEAYRLMEKIKSAVDEPDIETLVRRDLDDFGVSATPRITRYPRLADLGVIGPGVEPLRDWLEERGLTETIIPEQLTAMADLQRLFFVVLRLGIPDSPRTQTDDAVKQQGLSDGLVIALKISFRTPIPCLPAGLLSPRSRGGKVTVYVLSQRPLKSTNTALQIERWIPLRMTARVVLSRYLPVYDALVVSKLSSLDDFIDIGRAIPLIEMNEDEEAAYSVAGLRASRELGDRGVQATRFARCEAER